MSLRPRYSLLTLLLLTALVAGGIKLWRGPHHAEMSDPPTAEERLLLEQLFFSDALQQVYKPVVYEYEYLNEWNNRRYLFVKGSTTGKRPIPVWKNETNPQYAGLHLRYPSPEPELLALEMAQTADEHVVCWVFPTSAKTSKIDSAQLYEMERMGRRTYVSNACYFLTSRKQLYLFDGLPYLRIPLKRVELSDIEDSEFRQRVAAELAKIPEPEASR